MNCNEFEQQLDTEIGKRPLGAIAELSEHAIQCDQCIELWNGYLRLEENLLQWNSNLPEIDIVDYVITQMNDDFLLASSNDLTSATPQPQVTLSRIQPSGKSKTESSGRSLTLVIVTAVMMLAIGLLMFQPSNQTTKVASISSHDLVVNDVSPETITDENASPEIRSLVKNAGSAYYSLAQNAVDVFADASILLPDSEEIQIPLLLQDETMPQPLDDIMETIENDVKPIQSDLRKAIEFLFISVPDHTS